MQLLLFAVTFLSLSAKAFAQNSTSFSTTITYDTLYDNGNASTTSISCSNGNNGVICKDCTLMLSEIPGWPNITGAPSRVITGWNADGCRTCWALTLPDFLNTTLYVRAIDAAGDSFNVGFDIMKAVTGGRALERGRVNVVARSVGPAACEQGQRPSQPLPRPQATCPPPNFGCSS